MAKASSVPTQGSEEEQLGEDEAGDGAVEKEVVPLDGRADSGSDHGAAQLDLMFGRRKLKGSGIGRDHERFSRRPPRGWLGAMMKLKFVMELLTCPRVPARAARFLSESSCTRTEIPVREFLHAHRDSCPRVPARAPRLACRIKFWKCRRHAGFSADLARRFIAPA
jgi:hypothetical protein